MPAPRRVLIVEDEVLVSILIEDALADLGIEVAGVAATLEEALAHAEAGNFDCAILDVHIQGKNVFPVAEALEARGVPFVFASGYGQRGVPEKYRGRPVLQKPFMTPELERALGGLAGRDGKVIYTRTPALRLG
jgi:CheY-like chemotaxis protein